MDILNFEDIQLVRKQTVLLQDINWQIAKNQHWALLGLNGAGKTLLLQLIIGMIWPTSGKRQVLGQVYGKTSVPDLQRRIGWISATLQEKIPAQELSEMVVLSGKYASIGIYEDYQNERLEPSYCHSLFNWRQSTDWPAISSVISRGTSISLNQPRFDGKSRIVDFR